jgi:UDP-N-acetylmuramate dehydrogenase
MYADMPGYVVDDTHMKIPAAWLIEQCGWKGAALGRAGVHLRQPLVLVNLGGATGNDIKLLSDRIQQDVLGKFGVKITPEVNFI